MNFWLLVYVIFFCAGTSFSPSLLIQYEAPCSICSLYWECIRPNHLHFHFTCVHFGYFFLWLVLFFLSLSLFSFGCVSFHFHIYIRQEKNVNNSWPQHQTTHMFLYLSPRFMYSLLPPPPPAPPQPHCPHLFFPFFTLSLSIRERFLYIHAV